MLPELISRLDQSVDMNHDYVAVGIDARSEPDSLGSLIQIIDNLDKLDNLTIDILFLETNQDILLKRFSETRRKHPLSNQKTPLLSAIGKEAGFLLPLKERADLVIDTSRLNLHQLREIIFKRMVGQILTGIRLSVLTQDSMNLFNSFWKAIKWLKKCTTVLNLLLKNGFLYLNRKIALTCQSQ